MSRDTLDPVSAGERLPAFDGFVGDAGKALRAAVVTCVGTGSVGRPFCEHMARLGVGALRAIDRGKIKRASLATHAGVYPEHLDHAKASDVAEICKRINAAMNVIAIDGAVEDLPMSRFVDSDIVFLASDNLAAEVHVGQVCQWLSKPLVQMAVHGATLLVTARTFKNACPRCLYGQAEEQALQSGRIFSCEGAAANEPTMSTSALCSVAAGIGATLVTRHLLGLGTPLGDALYQWCGYTMQSWTMPTRRRNDCPQEHVPWELVRLPRPAGAFSLRQIAAACGCRWNERLEFELEGIAYAAAGTCACGNIQRIECWISAETPSCNSCGESLSVPRVYALQRVAAERLEARSTSPFERLTGRSSESVILRDGHRTWLICSGGK